MIAFIWLNSLERNFHLLFIWIYFRSKILLWLRFVITVYWWSVIMVTRYNVISSRWSNQFWVTMNVFSTSFDNKSKACVWRDAKCLFMCYFTRQAQKKIPFIAITPSSMFSYGWKFGETFHSAGKTSKLETDKINWLTLDVAGRENCFSLSWHKGCFIC